MKKLLLSILIIPWLILIATGGSVVAHTTQDYLVSLLKEDEIIKIAHEVYDPKITDSTLVTVIDFTLPSTVPRLWVIDTADDTIKYNLLVAHAANSGNLYATSFSNVVGSNYSSLGLYKTGVTYYGRNGYSLRLHGLDKGINDNAYDRYIVLHGSRYVTQNFIDRWGRLGRSLGCPAIDHKISHEVIDLLKNGTLLYIHHSTY